MKTSIISLTLILAGLSAQAQKTSVTDIPTDESTTIHISKGNQQNSPDRDYDIVSSTAEVVGDSAPLTADAKTAWKKACSDWKSELKNLNKENTVLALSCNRPNCTTDLTNGTTCQSTATYQLKVKVRNK